MKKTQLSVHFPPDLRDWIRSKAKEKSTSEAAIVRQAVIEKKEREKKEKEAK